MDLEDYIFRLLSKLSLVPCHTSGNVVLTNMNFLGQKEPTNTARAKYSTKGGFTSSSFAQLGLAPSLVLPLMQCANFSLAANTWKSYQTAERHIKRAEEHAGHKLVFPFSLKSTFIYMAYLLDVRKISGVTLEKYQSAIRMVHMQKGFFSPWLRPEIVKQIVSGAQNRDQLIQRMSGKQQRQPITINLLKTLKFRVKEANWSKAKKRLVWLICTLAWAGAFRIHELLAREAMHYDLTTTLLWQDITVAQTNTKEGTVQSLRVFLKHPKETKLSAGVVMEVFDTKNPICPVEAFHKWNKDKNVSQIGCKPAFRLPSGMAYTGKQFNKDLKDLLKNDADYNQSKISSHSFRQG